MKIQTTVSGAIGMRMNGKPSGAVYGMWVPTFVVILETDIASFNDLS